jgi:hypothetical protein
MMFMNNWGLHKKFSKKYECCLVGIDLFSTGSKAMPVNAINAKISIPYILIVESRLGSFLKILTDSSLYLTLNIFKR